MQITIPIVIGSRLVGGVRRDQRLQPERGPLRNARLGDARSVALAPGMSLYPTGWPSRLLPLRIETFSTRGCARDRCRESSAPVQRPPRLRHRRRREPSRMRAETMRRVPKSARQRVAFRRDPLETERKRFAHSIPRCSRVWKIVNPKRKNRLGQPVGYKLMPGRNSNAPRASRVKHREAGRFVRDNLWVTPTPLMSSAEQYVTEPKGPYRGRQD